MLFRSINQVKKRKKHYFSKNARGYRVVAITKSARNTKKYDPYQEIRYDSIRVKIPKFDANLLDEGFVEYPKLLHDACTPKVLTTVIGYFVR